MKNKIFRFIPNEDDNTDDASYDTFCKSYCSTTARRNLR